MLTLAFVPTGLLLVTHLAKPVATDRGMILFTPFLLAALAHAVWILTRRRIAGALIVTALVGAFALSIVRFRARQGPNDYRGLATRMATLFENADRIFVRPIDWVSTPLYYHLGRDTTRLVATEYREFVCKFAPRRVWVPEFSDRLVISDITMALRGYRQDTTVVAHNARATLYTRD